MGLGWGWGGARRTTKVLFLVSQVISQTWPYLSMIMENKFREKLEPKIREKSVHLRTFAFTKLHFGQKVGAPWGRPAGPALPFFLCPRPLPQVTNPTEKIPLDLTGASPACPSQPLGLCRPPTPHPPAQPSPPAGSQEAWLRERGGGVELTPLFLSNILKTRHEGKPARYKDVQATLADLRPPLGRTRLHGVRQGREQCRLLSSPTDSAVSVTSPR